MGRKDDGRKGMEVAVVQTNPIPKWSNLGIMLCRHVFAFQHSQEKRQAPPLLEHRGKQARVRWASGATPRALSGRDQYSAAGELGAHHRVFRRGWAAAQDGEAVARTGRAGGDRGEGRGAWQDGDGAHSGFGDGIAPPTAMGRLLAGLPALRGTATP